MAIPLSWLSLVRFVKTPATVVPSRVATILLRTVVLLLSSLLSFVAGVSVIDCCNDC